MISPVLLVAAMLAPGVFSWWTGRLLLRLRDDPALPERMLMRRQHTQIVILLGCVLCAYAAGTSAWFAIVGLVVGTWVGDYPARRVLLDERWRLTTYLAWHARFTAASFGFWYAMLLAPSVVLAAGDWRWPVAATLAAALGVWTVRHGAVLLWLVRARPLDPPAAWEAILARSSAPRPRLLIMPVPGGRFVNAFALPAATPSVLFTESLRELLDPREQGAVLAHELAHLEHHDRRRRLRAAVAAWLLAAAATLGTALAVDHVGGGLLVAAWSATVVVGLALRASRHKAHEADSDLRALALCGDPEALISGLTKLTAAGRLPRRWSPEFEQHASHPSLARRVQAIRRAAGLTTERPATPDGALVVATAQPDARLIFDDRGVSWVGGVADADGSDPAVLRQTATASWAAPYTDLVELRVAASWWGGAALRVRTRGGVARSVRLTARDVQAVQRRLDAVDDRLPHDAVRATPPPAVGRLVALALSLVCVTAGVWLGLVVGLAGAVRPSRAALAAVAGTAAACVLVTVGDLAGGAAISTRAFSAVAAAVVAAFAAWLAARPRTVEDGKLDYLPVLVATGGLAILAWASTAADLVSRDVGGGTVLHALGHAPTLWVAVGAAGCALLTRPRRRARRGGAVLVAVAVLLNLGVRVGDLAALSRLVTPASAEPRPLPLLATLGLPVPATTLRVSPLGTRLAVPLLATARTPSRVLVLGVSGDRRELEARDLEFVDEDNALVVVEGEDGLSVEHVRLADGREPVRGARAAVPGVTGLRLSSVRDGAWAALAYDARTESTAGVTGRVGSADVTRQPLDAVDDEVPTSDIQLAPDGRGLRFAIDRPPSTRSPWARALLGGGLRPQTRLTRVGGAAPQPVGSLPAYASCRLVGRDVTTVVCVGTEPTRTLIWRFDVAGAPGQPLVVPGLGRPSGVSRDARLVALWSRREVAVVDLDFAREQRWTVAPDAGYPIHVVPAGDRLLTLLYARTGATVHVYDARW